MDYGRLIGDAWRLTINYRFLWILGLLMPATFGSCSGYQPNVSFQFPGNVLPGDLPPATEAQIARFFTGVGEWIAGHLLLIVAAILGLVLMGLLLWLLSIVAQGGMARASLDLASGGQVTLGSAWGAGVAMFWRYLGLNLLVFAAVVAIAVVIILGVLLLILIGSAVDGGGRVAIIVLGVLVGLALAMVSIPFGIVASIVLAFAQRAMAERGNGPIGALGYGWRLLRANLGSSLLVWAINLGLGIAAGLGGAVVSLVILAALAAVGFGVYLAASFSTVLFVYAALAFLVLMIVAWLIGALVNVYFWHYWTLAYLRLPRQPTPTSD